MISAPQYATEESWRHRALQHRGHLPRGGSTLNLIPELPSVPYFHFTTLLKPLITHSNNSEPCKYCICISLNNSACSAAPERIQSASPYSPHRQFSTSVSAYSAWVADIKFLLLPKSVHTATLSLTIDVSRHITTNGAGKTFPFLLSADAFFLLDKLAMPKFSVQNFAPSKANTRAMSLRHMLSMSHHAHPAPSWHLFWLSAGQPN